MKRILLISLVVALLAGAVFISKFRSEPDRVTGMIEADDMRLGSRIGGRVARVLVEEGDRVEDGQVLIELEPFDLLEQTREAAALLASREAEYQRLEAGYREEERAQAKARLQQQQSQLQMLQTGPRSQEIEAARARLRLANAQFQLAQRTHQRDRQLIESNAISQEQLDRSGEELESAAAQVEVARENLDLLEAGTRAEELQIAEARLEEAQQAWKLMENGYRSEEIAQAKAMRDAAQAQLDALRRREEELQIHAPEPGVIEALELQPGDLVAPNAPVLSLLSDRRLWVRAYIPEDRLDVQVGNQLEVSVDSYPGERFPGTVTYVSRQAEFTPSNVQTPDERSKQVFRIKVELTDGASRLRPGMAADVWLDSRTTSAAAP